MRALRIQIGDNPEQAAQDLVAAIRDASAAGEEIVILRGSVWEKLTRRLDELGQCLAIERARAKTTATRVPIVLN